MCRVPSLEADLNHRGISWEFREQVPLKEINVKGSHQNPARLGLRVTPAVVSAVFCSVLDRGHTRDLEAVICSDRHSPMDLLDGVNRCEGVDEAEGQRLIDAYVITSPDEFILEFVAGWANNRNGSAPLEDQRLRRAVELHEHWPDKTLDQISRLCNLRAEEIAEFKKLRRQAKRAEELDIVPQFNGLKPKVQTALAAITLDNLFAAVVIALADTDAKVGPSLDLIKRVSKARSEQAARKAIDEWKEENPAAKPNGGKGPKTITTKYRAAQRALFNIWPGSVERIQLGSFDLNGLTHLLDIVQTNQDHGEQVIHRLKDLIEYHKKHSTPPAGPERKEA